MWIYFQCASHQFQTSDHKKCVKLLKQLKFNNSLYFFCWCATIFVMNVVPPTVISTCFHIQSLLFHWCCSKVLCVSKRAGRASFEWYQPLPTYLKNNGRGNGRYLLNSRWLSAKDEVKPAQSERFAYSYDFLKIRYSKKFWNIISIRRMVYDKGNGGFCILLGEFSVSKRAILCRTMHIQVEPYAFVCSRAFLCRINAIIHNTPCRLNYTHFIQHLIWNCVNLITKSGQNNSSKENGSPKR